MLDLSRHYPHPLPLSHFYPPPPEALHIKLERRGSTPHHPLQPYLHAVKQEPQELDEQESVDLSFRREQERDLSRSFSLPAPRDPVPPPERQVSLERGRDGGAPTIKPEHSSRTVIGNTAEVLAPVYGQEHLVMLLEQYHHHWASYKIELT